MITQENQMDNLDLINIASPVHYTEVSKESGGGYTAQVLNTSYRGYGATRREAYKDLRSVISFLTKLHK